VSGALLGAARYLALILAVSLAIAEAVINESQPEWQYAPLWIIDYAISTSLLAGFWLTRRGRWIPILMTAYALALGVFYLAFFQHFDPELPEEARGSSLIVFLIGLALAASAAGLAAATTAWVRAEKARTKLAPEP
jgi:hypothetical protein